MEKKAKRGFRFNIIDIILLLVIIAAVLGVIYFFLSHDDVPGASDTFSAEYVIESKEIRDEFDGLIKPGDIILDSVRQIKLGEVLYVEYVDAVRTTVNTDTGEQKNVEVPGKLDVYITIRSTDVTHDECYKINGSYDLMTGSYFSYRTPGFVGEGSCVSVKILNK
ncbi:MAG: DUF4330 family protein [Clostridia bacterium]|nr:DUF4330 family protein [Clostridia bacterium]